MTVEPMYPNWESHPPTAPPDNKIRRQEDLISLSDIYGLIPTMQEPGLWLFSKDGRESVLNACKLRPAPVLDGEACSHEQDEDCDRESGCSWEFGGPCLSMLTSPSTGGVFACHRVAFDYMMTHDTFRRWCEAGVSACEGRGSWDDLTDDLVCRLIVLAVNRGMNPDDVPGLMNRTAARAVLEFPVPLLTRGPTIRARRVATYFVQAENGGLVKIGKSNNIRSRLAALQTGSPVRLSVIGAVRGDREAEFHLRFKGLRSHGEWFKPNAELLGLVETEGANWVLVDRWCSGKDEPS